MLHFLHDFWPHLTIVSLAIFIIEMWAAAHAVLYKRDSRATIGWVGLILLTPLVGALLYWMFGINRIHRRAKLRRSGETGAEPRDLDCIASQDTIGKTLEHDGRHFRRLIELTHNATGKPLLEGNKIEPLVNGDEAYPAMLQAIDGAKRSITLASYIFDNDRVGKLFAHALSEAQTRC